MAKNRISWGSTPIVNIIQDFPLDEMMWMHCQLRSPVDRLKTLLGKQAYTWVSPLTHNKYWVWEGADWRVFANNVRGVKFEVRAALNKTQAQEAWEDFKKKIS